MNLSKAVYQKYSLLILVGIIIGLGFHLGLIVMDSMMEEKPIYFNLDKKFFQSVFSFPFLPILIIEIFFSSLTIYLWFSLRHAAKKAYELDVKNEKYKTDVVKFAKDGYFYYAYKNGEIPVIVVSDKKLEETYFK